MLLETIENGINIFNKAILSIIWANVNPMGDAHVPLIVLIAFLFCIYFLFSLKFNAITHFVQGMKIMLSSGGHGGGASEKKQSISSFRALFTSIAGAAGLGNIAGVAIGISLGGPGVVFWILIAAILCMPLRFAEVYLGHKYRSKHGDGYRGGPYWYIKLGFEKLKKPKIGAFLASFYGIALVFSVYGGATSFQTNQAVKVAVEHFALGQTGKYAISAAMAIFVFCIAAGGVKKIANYCSSAVMFFMSFYLLVLIAALVFYRAEIPATFTMIMQYAFTKSAAYGGIVAVLFSAFQRLQLANETGFGTAAIIHANSQQEDSVKEALVAMICPIVDAIFVCFVTGLVICLGMTFTDNKVEGIMMVQNALTQVHPIMAYFLPLAIPLVALNVMIAWSYYGISNLEFLLKTKKFSIPYLATICIAGFLGGIMENFKTIIDLCNALIFLMFIPNIIAIFVLRKEVNAAWTKYVLNSKYNDKNK